MLWFVPVERHCRGRLPSRMASLYYHFVDSRVDSKTGDEERLSANVYEQKSMIEAVCMSSKRPTVAIKMLLTATREQLNFILI